MTTCFTFPGDSVQLNMLQKEAHLCKEVCEALKAVLIYQKIASPPPPSLPEKQNKEKSGKMNYEQTTLRNLHPFV